MRVLSLGWGVQSFTLAAMSALGELEPLDAAIHADTRYERQGTYEFAEKWTPWLRERGVQVETVRCPEIRGGVTYPNGYDTGRGMHTSLSCNIPAFTVNDVGDEGQIRRQCTEEWKLRPFRAAIRSRNLPKGEQAEVWIGISADEFQRAKDADVRYLRHRFPLLERNIDRAGCVGWPVAHGLDVPPKSACVFCPYQNARSFAALKRWGGSDWATALAADEEIRLARPPYALFIHPARIPLAKAVDIPEDHGYVQTGFDPEGRCDEGVCWV
jgi:hypothetical protein